MTNTSAKMKENFITLSQCLAGENYCVYMKLNLFKNKSQL